ncbi:META domain-containing protein [Clavibacter sp. CT19]|uniref:META domain-containing protein n=1 Tax=Clavibacter sp. CT19 TaxID=3018990 RepID=UPI0022EA60E6|nr:META domain-containing protein [Clavibacter sp. CT19]MDA3804407.1 META domain-containing protein [Clavibacter sp. CT19]
MPTAARIPAPRRSAARRAARAGTGRVGGTRVRAGLAASAAALALVPLAGCAPVSDVRGNWHLVAARDSGGALAIGDTLITMRVGGGEISGRGPCNDYSGPIRDSGEGMLAAVAPGALPCDDAGVEAEYFHDLAEVTSWRVDDGHLVASGADGVRLEYAERSRG